MTLTKNDLQAIGSLIENRVRPVIKEEINVLRAEMHEAFRKQAESLSRAIVDTTASAILSVSQRPSTR